MSEKKPRPFHIGTQVSSALSPSGERGTVAFAWQVHGEQLVLLRGELKPYGKHVFVHASDGAPLGEWVPISEDSIRVYHHDGEMVLLEIDDVNDFIRGEAAR